MKKLLFILALSSTVASAQWVQKTSCKKDAAKITNEAIESIANLEYLPAMGMAKAALLLDPECGCAQLALAAISSPNPNWGSQKSKLEAMNVSKLSAEEKAWHEFLMASRTNRPSVAQAAATKYPDSPLVNLLVTSPADFNSFKTFAEKFPNQAAAAYNMMSYGYLRGDYGEPNQDMAMDYVKRSQQMHDGPNAHDSMAEHYAAIGDYQKALDAELKAVDYARFGSPYWDYARTYYAKVNQEELSKELMKNQTEAQDAVTNGDYETFSKYEHPDIIHTTGDSNLSPFYTFNKASFDREQAIVWNKFELNNMNVTYSPDMRTAVLTFYASGSYTFKDTKEEVAYSTRGSSVWVDTADGWKIMHSSWAPNKDGKGIPQS
ncbi:MAG: nuclear transport factor 2 family protein [Flavobacteriaceae bacterium]|nr:nuclear transport factor 2 family protein [Flavobacteriaceae bacterium]